MSSFKQCNYSDNGKRSKYKSEEIKAKSYYDDYEDCPDKGTEHCSICQATRM